MPDVFNTENVTVVEVQPGTVSVNSEVQETQVTASAPVIDVDAVSQNVEVSVVENTVEIEIVPGTVSQVSQSQLDDIEMLARFMRR